MTTPIARPPIARRSFILGAAGLVVTSGPLGLVGPASAGLPPTKKLGPDLLIAWVDAVFEQVRAERFSPTSAARAYAHVALAGYEAVVGGMPKHRSLSGQLNGFATLPKGSGQHWELAMNEAVGVAAQEVFADRSEASRAALASFAAANAAALSAGVPAQVVRKSIAFGTTVGNGVAARARQDNYLTTRGLAYTPPVGVDKWIRTPPNFGSALEPHWGQVQSFTLLTNNECKPQPPIPYSEAEGSDFWNQANTTYKTVNALTDETKEIALSWRDNPDGSSGLPSGHWMRIACIAIADQGLDLGEAAEVLALTGLALADGFTACWTEKYESNLLRPVTYIQRIIDPNWASFVNSPAFPEYTSGHSVGSAAAAETLTALLGDIPFVDNTGLVNKFPAVQYGSFWEAANEAAISRLYGGIHYPMGIEVGLTQGAAVAQKVLERAVTRRHGSSGSRRRRFESSQKGR